MKNRPFLALNFLVGMTEVNSHPRYSMEINLSINVYAYNLDDVAI